MQGFTVVTLDADFHTILMLRQAKQPSVIRIRIQGLDDPAATAVLIPIVRRFLTELLSGAMITIKSQKVTCRLLSTPESPTAR
jgi:predicted nuclease of predicted toxin-antitoxin system